MISNGIKVILVLSILLPAVVPSQPPVSVPETTRAVSVMSGPTDVKGVIVFESLGHDWIRVTGSITGLQPGPHGFHVHKLGDLTNGCVSAGEHFNPFRQTHGGLKSKVRHAGDLGNIVANAEGVAMVDLVARQMALSGPLSIIGRSIVIHADKDDLGLGHEPDSPTTGHSGTRVGCGVIGRS
ncbi:hypothetical protein EMCRGX_G034521 [Ephydatia muelleri]|eukprot:Em0023g422a